MGATRRGSAVRLRRVRDPRADLGVDGRRSRREPSRGGEHDRANGTTCCAPPAGVISQAAGEGVVLPRQTRDFFTRTQASTMTGLPMPRSPGATGPSRLVVIIFSRRLYSISSVRAARAAEAAVLTPPIRWGRTPGPRARPWPRHPSQKHHHKSLESACHVGEAARIPWMRSPVSGLEMECNGPQPESVSTCPDTSYSMEPCRPATSMPSGSVAHRDVVSGPFTDPEMAGAVSDPSGTCAAIAWQRERETNARAI